MILQLGAAPGAVRCSSVGPSISGMTTSETTRSISPSRSRHRPRAPRRRWSPRARCSRARPSARAAKARTASSSSTSRTRAAAGQVARASRPSPSAAWSTLRRPSPIWRGRKMRKIVPSAELAVEEDVAAGLLDDAVDRRQAEPGALADLLGGEERLEDLVHAPPAACRCRCRSTSISTYSPGGMPLLAEARAHSARRHIARCGS